MRAAIAGAGIAGLATAIALRRANVSSDVYERVPEIRELGAGLALWANGVTALDLLGIKTKVLTVSSVVKQGVTMNDRGRVLNRIDFASAGRPYGSVCICLHRGELQRILLDAAGKDTVHTGLSCVEVQQDSDQASIRFNDGSCVEADFLIAADGIRSNIRNQLKPASHIRFAGYSAWRGIVEGTFLSLPQDTTHFILGQGCQAGIFHCGPNRAYWFATQNARANPGLLPEVRKAALMRRFADWPAPFPSTIEATTAESILETDVLEVEPLKTWGVGRITFVGDAIHAMTPDLGQGAALALEDAVVLARCLLSKAGVEHALREYERLRRERTTQIAIASRRAGTLLQIENPVAVLLRDWFISTKLASWQSLRFFKQLFEFR